MDNVVIVFGLLFWGSMLFLILKEIYKDSSSKLLALILIISALVSWVVLLDLGIQDNSNVLGEILIYTNFFIHWVIYSTIDKRGTSKTPLQRLNRYLLERKVLRIFDRYKFYKHCLGINDYHLENLVFHAKADGFSASDIAMNLISIALDSVNGKTVNGNKDYLFLYYTDNGNKQLIDVWHACERERNEGRLSKNVYGKFHKSIKSFISRFNIESEFFDYLNEMEQT